MIYTAIILLALCLAGCNLRSVYPTLGGVIGGSAGTLAGGPVVGGLSAGAGVLAGEALKNKDALIEAEEKIVALSHGDVSKLVAQGMEEHKTGFDAIHLLHKKDSHRSGSITRWLPRHTNIHCKKDCPKLLKKRSRKKHMTRAPFPCKTSLP